MTAYLVLESGEVYKGVWQGGEDRAGEVVFNTSHSGYEEIATDPSYFSQILVLTAPMQGNYGVSDEVWESRKIWIEGFICLEIQDSERDHAWKERLTTQSIPLVTEIDTRALVMRLRSGGTSWGALVKAKSEVEACEKSKTLIAAKKNQETDWVYVASRKTAEVRKGNNMVGPKIAVLDFGSKENILRELELRCSEIKIFNSRSSVQEILDYKPDGIMLTNGPGNPEDVKISIGTVRELLGVKPIFGICMGHQILALALGAETYKMKFGHRGSNHPIQDDLLKQIYVTSQNHGYAVKETSLPADIKVTQRNLNDSTVAGFYSEIRKCLGIQYHPESCPGPHEATALFDYFVERML
jgi:carbamoyl-phosphate synthase small subunit